MTERSVTAGSLNASQCKELADVEVGGGECTPSDLHVHLVLTAAAPLQRLCRTILRANLLPYLTAARLRSGQWQGFSTSCCKGVLFEISLCSTGAGAAELAPAVTTHQKPSGLLSASLRLRFLEATA